MEIPLTDRAGRTVARDARRIALFSVFALGCFESPSDPTVHWQPGPPTRLIVSRAELSLIAGDSELLLAAPIDSQGRIAKGRVTWTTSDPAVAQVDPAQGLVRAISAGTVTITAKLDTLRVSSVVTVVELRGTIAFSRSDLHRSDVVTFRTGIGRTELRHPFGHYLDAPDWAPDGTTLVVQETRADANVEHPSDIVLVNPSSPSTQDAWRYLTRDGRSRSPNWSPDGKRLAYVSGSVLQTDIYVVDVAGGAPVRLTQQSGDYWWPRWSPDGARIAFVESPTPGRSGGIYVMNSNGTGLVKLSPFTRWSYGPSWSPDGTRLTLDTDLGDGYGLYTLDTETRLHTLRVRYGPGDEGGGSAWSADGRLILYALITHVGGQNADDRSGLYLINADGSGPRQLTRPGRGAYDVSPSWR